MNNNILVLALLAGLISGCGGDDGGNWSREEVENITRSAMAQLAEKEWILYNNHRLPRSGDDFERNNHWACDTGRICTEDRNIPGLEGFSMRYELSEENPIKLFVYIEDEDGNTTIPQYVYDGIQMIEDIIGFDYPIFTEIEQIHVIDPDRYFDIDYSDAEGTAGGIIIAIDLLEGTGQCGLWSRSFASTAPAGMVVNELNEFATDKGWSWVSVGGPTCSADANIMAHELMHALGFKEHFEGFGINGVIGAPAKTALRTLYNNPSQMDHENMEIYHYE